MEVDCPWKKKSLVPHTQIAHRQPLRFSTKRLSVQKYTMFKTLKSKFGSLRNDVFERCTSTGSGFFVLLRRDFEQMFRQIFSIRVNRVKTLSNTILASVKAYYNRLI